LAVGFVVALWWASTGLVLYLDGLPRRTFRWSLGAATVLLAAALAALAASRDETTIAGAGLAFVCGLMVWGWNELAFLTGAITGPNRRACPPGLAGWRHFMAATGSILWHELAIAASALAILAATAGGDNRVGLWTFLILWVMRLSTKLNVFLGVPNLSEEFLPDHLKYIASFFRRRPMNLLFPVSVTATTVLFVVLAGEAIAAHDPFAITSATLLAALVGLALLEHWFLVLPIPAMELWRWGLKSRSAHAEPPEGEPRRAPGVERAPARIGVRPAT
jgi:putative photosynthetic complex assembly protein 2